MQDRMREQFVQDEAAKADLVTVGRHDAEELARSLLAEMTPERRVRFCALAMIEVNGAGVLQALLDARNLITSRAKDLIVEDYGQEAE